MMTSRCLVMAFLGFSCAVAPWPAAAQGFGAIGGSVLDESGATLPGATVVLSSLGVIGGDRETFTDARGFFRFDRLVPGSYGVRASLPGFQTVVQEGIVVNSDATARVDLQLPIGTVEETITVSGLAPLLDTTSALKQTVLSRETIDALPNRHNVWSIARSAPAIMVQRYDVGGSDTFRQTTPRAHGASTREGAYQFDGMDIGYAGSEGGLIMYLDAHMFEEVNLQTGANSAESAKGGVVTNLITRTGTNIFAGRYKFTGAGAGMHASNLTPELRADLLAAVPATTLAANPDIQPGAEILGNYDNSVTMSGPIVRDRLWFSGTASLVLQEQYLLSSYNPDGTKVLEDNRMRNGQYKISWQARPGHHLHFMHNFNSKERAGWGGGGVDFFETNWLRKQRINTNLYQTKWTSILPGQMLFDVSASIQDSLETNVPQPGLSGDALSTFDSITRVHGGASPQYYDRPSWRHNILTSLSFITGAHDVKLGYQFMYRHHGDTFYSIGPYAPSGLRAIFRDGVPTSVNTYTTPLHFDLYSRDHAWYVQDRWVPTTKLTLNVGVRLETSYGRFPSMCLEDTIFIEGQCFPAVEGLPDWFGVSPRFSLIYDVAGDGTTALKFTANRYNTPYGNTLLSRFNPVSLSSDTRSWNDVNGDLIPQLDELGPSTGFNIGTTNRYGEGTTWPYSTEYTVGLEQQLPYGLVAAATYIHRRRQNEIGARNLAVPPDSYTPLEVTEATSGRPVTVYDLDPMLRGQFDVLRTNERALDAEFNGVDLTLNKRMSDGWMLMGGLSLGKNVGDIYGENADLNDPNLQFRRGVIEYDIPVAVKAFGVYEAPYGIAVNVSFQHFTGYPENTTVLVASDTVALTRVRQSLTLEPRATTRAEDVNMVDLSLRRAFTVGRYNIEPVLDIFNLTNDNAIVRRTTQLGPTYGRANDMLRGRLMKVGVDVTF